MIIHDLHELPTIPCYYLSNAHFLSNILILSTKAFKHFEIEMDLNWQ